MYFHRYVKNDFIFMLYEISNIEERKASFS